MKNFRKHYDETIYNVKPELTLITTLQIENWTQDLDICRIFKVKVLLIV